jgi:cytochrome P450
LGEKEKHSGIYAKKCPATTCPRGILLIVNAYTIHRDPAVWVDPAEFRLASYARLAHADSIAVHC